MLPFLHICDRHTLSQLPQRTFEETSNLLTESVFPGQQAMQAQEMIRDERYTNHGNPSPLGHTLASLVSPVGGGSPVRQFKQMILKRNWMDTSEKDCSLLGKHRRKDCLTCLSSTYPLPWKGMWYLRLRQPFWDLVAISRHTKDGRIKGWREPGGTAEQLGQPWDHLPLTVSELHKQIVHSLRPCCWFSVDYSWKQSWISKKNCLWHAMIVLPNLTPITHIHCLYNMQLKSDRIIVLLHSWQRPVSMLYSYSTSTIWPY